MRRYGGPGVKKQACENRPKCKALQACKSVPLRQPKRGTKPLPLKSQTKFDDGAKGNKVHLTLIAKVNISKQDVMRTKSYTKSLMQSMEVEGKEQNQKGSDPNNLNALLSKTVADWTEPENILDELENCTVVVSNEKCIMIPSPAKTTLGSMEPEYNPGKTSNQDNVKENQMSKLSPNSRKRLSCECCEFVGKSSSGLKRHISRYHQQNTKTQSPEPTQEDIEIPSFNKKNIEPSTNSMLESHELTYQKSVAEKVLDVSEEKDQTNGTLHTIVNKNSTDLPDDSGHIDATPAEINKSFEDLINNTTQPVATSLIDITPTKEKKKTAIVSPLIPEDTTSILQCEDCNFVGKTTSGLKRHKSTAHRLSLKHRRKHQAQKKNNAYNESEIDNADESDKEDDNGSQSSSMNSSFHSYPTALPADYLQYIYL